MRNWLAGSRHAEARKLVNHLKDASRRERAGGELLRLGPEAVPALVEALQSPDQNLIPLYQDVLVQIGPPATPALARSLLNGHPILRGRVAEVLAQTRDVEAVPALLSALRGEFYTVRGRAAMALGAIGAQEAVGPLTEALKDPEVDVRIEAVSALGTFKDPDTFDAMADLLLEDPQIKVRQAAAAALGETKHPGAIPYLMIALSDPFWWYERESAAEALLEAIEGMGAAAVEPLLEALVDKEGTVRRFAARSLGRIKDPRAIQPLGMSLYDTHFEVGKTAAEALAGFGPVGLKVLASALHHPEAWLRQHAITGLTLSGDQRIVPVILDMLNDPDREVRKQAIQSLGTLNDERAIPALQSIALDRLDREMSGLARDALTAVSN